MLKQDCLLNSECTCTGGIRGGVFECTVSVREPVSERIRDQSWGEKGFVIHT